MMIEEETPDIAEFNLIEVSPILLGTDSSALLLEMPLLNAISCSFLYLANMAFIVSENEISLGTSVSGLDVCASLVKSISL